MRTTSLIRFQLLDSLRGKAVPSFGLFFVVVTELLLRFGGTGERAVLSLMNVSLSVIPLFALIMGTIYLYSHREYVELMLTQPIRRGSLFLSLYLGLSLPMAAVFALGVGLPALFRGQFGVFLPLIGTGAMLALVFVAIAFILALRFEDKAKGMGAAIATWLLLTVVYDGFIMLAIAMFANFPLERPVLFAAMLNPVDLGRLLMVLSADVSAMMGFTGALYKQFFGSMLGTWVASALLVFWLGIPMGLGALKFRKKDF